MTGIDLRRALAEPGLSRRRFLRGTALAAGGLPLPHGRARRRPLLPGHQLKGSAHVNGAVQVRLFLAGRPSQFAKNRLLGAGRPYVDFLEITTIADPTSRAAQLGFRQVGNDIEGGQPGYPTGPRAGRRRARAGIRCPRP
jgi:hypothetical protein